jgi:REP-associated tyrosine transposase
MKAIIMNPKPFPQRKSPRLQGYDYSQSGAYFVTICTYQRQLFFGDVIEDEMRLTALGELAAWHWQDLPNHFSHIDLDSFVVMPNHVHGIVLITDDMDVVPTKPPNINVGTQSIVSDAIQSPPAKRPVLGTIIGTYKAAVTRKANRQLSFEGRIWQGRFYDHIIRNETSLNKIRQYVIYNPAKWDEDRFYTSGE